MGYITLYIILSVTVSLASAASYDDCSESSVKTCLGDMMSVATAAQGGQIPSYTPGEFRNVCREFEEAKSCLNEIRGYCTQKERYELDSITTLFDYLCGDGFDIYIENNECLFKKELEDQLQVCLDKYGEQSQSLKFSYGSAREKLNKLCRYTNDYIGCAGNVAGESCGASARGLIVESAKLVFSMVFKQASFDCVINAGVGPTLTYWTLVVAGFLLLKNLY